MSKIILLSAPAHGHLNPTLPIITELVRRGHALHVYNTPEFRSQIENTGSLFHAYAPSELSAASLAGSVKDGNLANASVLMLRAAESLLPFVLDELKRAQPDLVIFDSLAVWGKMASNLLNLRTAASISHFVFDLATSRLTWGEMVAMFRQTFPKVPAILAARSRLVRVYGKAAFPPGNPLFPMRDKLNLMYTARELQPATSVTDATFRFVGPSLMPPSTETAMPLEALGSGPLVYISLGTVHSNQSDFYRNCFEAFAGVQARFVLSAGRETDISRLGTPPSNFLVRNTVPQIEVLKHAAFFITHGGMNSIHEALYHGVPLIIVPHQYEQLLNARVIEARGAALTLTNHVRGKPLTADDLRVAYEAAKSKPSLRTAASEVRRILAATGGYHQAADEIEEYMGKNAAVTSG